MKKEWAGVTVVPWFSLSTKRGCMGTIQPFGVRMRNKICIIATSALQLGNGVAEIAIRIKSVGAAILHDGGEYRGAFAAGDGAEEEPILAPNGPRAQRIFCRIIVDGQKNI